MSTEKNDLKYARIFITMQTFNDENPGEAIKRNTNYAHRGIGTVYIDEYNMVFNCGKVTKRSNDLAKMIVNNPHKPAFTIDRLREKLNQKRINQEKPSNQ